LFIHLPITIKEEEEEEDVTAFLIVVIFIQNSVEC
jgi:hypothetical protein